MTEVIKENIGLEQIKNYLPHRDPFLFITEMRDVEGEERGVGIWKLTGDEYFFKGHFPGNPICPGVLVIEAMAQSAGIVGCHAVKSKGALMLFTSIESAKFRSQVLPGDTVEIYVEKIQKRRNIWKYSAVAKVGDRVAAQAIVSAIHIEPKEE